MAGESGPARREDESPDQEKCDAGSTGTGDVIAESGGNAVFSPGVSLSSDDPLRDTSARPPSVSSSCLPSVVPSLPPFTPDPFPSSELDPVCVRTAAR